MGRSVSSPSGCIAIAYRTLEYYPDDYELSQIEFDDLINWIRETARDYWPSLRECNSWLGREDHAILENDFCYIGISEYYGLVAIWLLSKRAEHESDSYYDGEQALANLSDNWCKSVTPKFLRLFGTVRRVATFSNGETVYERVVS